MDGNFEASHQKMKRGEDDVALTDGHGFMVPESNYQEHLQTAIELKQVSCANMSPFNHILMLVEIKMS
jgi:hypothetical protein